MNHPKPPRPNRGPLGVGLLASLAAAIPALGFAQPAADHAAAPPARGIRPLATESVTVFASPDPKQVYML